MRVLKKVALVIVIIIAIPLVVAIFVKKDFMVEREVTIAKPKQEVFDYVRYLKNQDNYSVWNQKDPKMKREFRGTDGQIGAVSAWDSESDDVGKGEQEIAAIADGERIDYKLRFEKPMKAENDAYMTTETLSPDQTKVKWGFKGTMPYPFNIISLFVNMDQELGGELQKGLDQLKVQLESK